MPALPRCAALAWIEVASPTITGGGTQPNLVCYIEWDLSGGSLQILKHYSSQYVARWVVIEVIQE